MMERWCCQTGCGHEAMRNPVECLVFPRHGSQATRRSQPSSAPGHTPCSPSVPGDYGMIMSLSPLPSPEAALTSQVTLGCVAKSLHKLVHEVSSPTSHAGDFTTPWNRGHPHVIYTLTPFLNFVLSPLYLSRWEQALPSLQQFLSWSRLLQAQGGEESRYRTSGGVCLPTLLHLGPSWGRLFTCLWLQSPP